MVKTLLWYTACGDPSYLTMCTESIQTVRQYGRYTGDIAVLTDAPEAFQGMVRVTPIDLKPLLPAADPKVSARTRSMSSKAAIVRSGLIGHYAFSLYLDSDIYVVSPRFSELVNAMAAIGGMWVQQNYWANMSQARQVNQGSELDPSLFRLCQNLSVCSGIVGFGYDSYSDLGKWYSLCEQRQFAYDDQALLHIVAAGHNDGRVHYLPRSDVWFPTNRILNPSIYHFTTHGKPEMASMRRQLFDKT
jgi:hypothetical protein